MSSQSAQQTVAEFHAVIADPAVFCGGGSVAAITASGAAATALLVMRLNARRRSNADAREQIFSAIQRTERLIDEFHELADADIASLDALLQAQRAVKTAPEREALQQAYADALTAAANSPLSIGEAALELLRLVDAETSRAARFTVSDLGAAAALVDGAFRAASLTSEVNIALLREHPLATASLAEDIDRRRLTLLHEISALSMKIERAAHDRLTEIGNAQA